MEKLKPCPYNEKYMVSSKGAVYNSRGIKLTELKDTTYPYVQLLDEEGNPLRLPLARLVLETFRPVNSYNENRKVVHLDGDKYNCDLLNLVWFTRLGIPIVDKWEKDNNFVYIPGYSDYVINRHGKIIDTVRNKEVRYYDSHYRRVNLRTDDGVNRTCLVHRLVAMAFVQLPESFQDFGKLLVNHKDGNKYNPDYTNLEWCSYSGNLNHALESGLNGCIKTVYMRNNEDGKITKYLGLTKLSKELGISATTACEHIASGSSTLINGQYQLAYSPDAFSKASTKRASTLPKKVVVKELATGEDTQYDSIAAAWRALKDRGLKKSPMKARMRYANRYQVPYMGYVIKYLGDDWDIKENHRFTKKPVYVKNKQDGTIKKYDSARECARQLGISPDIVWTFLSSEKDEYEINRFILYREI